MAEFKRLPTQEELSKMLYEMQLGGKSQQDIINENLASGSTVKAIPENMFQKMAKGAGIAKEQVNKLGNAADLAKLFPGYTGQSQVNIPTGYNFAMKQSPTGEVMPAGMQSQPVNINQLLQAIKPADMLGLTGAKQAYTDVGMGKAPNPMDVMDVAGLGVVGIGAGKGLLGVAKATKGLPVGMGIKDVSKPSVNLQTLANEANKSGVKLDLYEKNGVINLSKIEVPKDARGTGIGSDVMNKIVNYADLTGSKIVLSPSKDFGASSVNRLKDFYKRFGFVENKGKSKDFSTRETMYREPSK